MKKSKVPRKGNKNVSNEYDQCQTPAYAIDPILPFIKGTIWECASGHGRMVRALSRAGLNVIGTDLLQGVNFFKYKPPAFDYIVTNPPYSIKQEWLSHCYHLGVPFALLLPVEALGASKCQRLFDQFGVEIIFMDKRVNFYMPRKGNKGESWFPVAWFTHGLNVGREMTFAHIEYRDDDQMEMLDFQSQPAFKQAEFSLT